MNKPEKINIVDYCSVCRSPLSQGTIFCPNCGPPRFSKFDTETGLSLGKTAIRIGLLVLLFSAVVVTKMDIPWTEWFSAKPGEIMVIPEKAVADDKDYELVHYINVSNANMRINPNKNGKVVLVVNKGDQIRVLEKGEYWSRVKVKDKTGWMATRLLTGTIE